MKKRVSSGSPLEREIGFSRAVRIGKLVAVAGTAPIGANGETVAPGDVAGQTAACLEIGRKSLEQLDLSMADVIRTRIMLTDATRWKEAAQVHGEYFSEIKPACTFVEVKGFINPEWLVEIELDAVASKQTL